MEKLPTPICVRLCDPIGDAGHGEFLKGASPEKDEMAESFSPRSSLNHLDESGETAKSREAIEFV